MLIQTGNNYGGFVHESGGDAHLISFGLVTLTPDLPDDAEFTEGLDEAIQRRHGDLCRSAIQFTQNFLRGFDQLLQAHDLPDSVRLGIGLDSGMVEIEIRGDGETRKKIDIEGEPVFRASRLEEYSKFIYLTQEKSKHVCVAAPIFAKVVDLSFYNFVRHETNQKVRDNPELDHCFVFARSAVQKTSTQIQ